MSRSFTRNLNINRKMCITGHFGGYTACIAVFRQSKRSISIKPALGLFDCLWASGLLRARPCTLYWRNKTGQDSVIISGGSYTLFERRQTKGDHAGALGWQLDNVTSMHSKAQPRMSYCLMTHDFIFFKLSCVYLGSSVHLSIVSSKTYRNDYYRQ